MSVTHVSGPMVVYGQDNSGAEVNPSPGISLFRHGVGLFDPRYFNPNTGGDVDRKNYGWMGTTRIPVVNATPAVMTTTNIAAAAVPVAGTPMTLVSVTGAGITAGATVTNALTGNQATVLAIETAFGTLNLGDNPTISMYDPAKAIARNVRITSAGNDSGATFTVAGYDIYGVPMTETIAGPNATTGSGAKAFKYISSVTPAGTLSGSNASVGTGDVYGFPLRVDLWGFIEIFWNSAFITATTGFTAAVTTDPATATTGDTRGTYAVQSASDGTKRLQIFVTPNPAQLSNVGLFGVLQA